MAIFFITIAKQNCIKLFIDDTQKLMQALSSTVKIGPQVYTLDKPLVPVLQPC